MRKAILSLVATSLLFASLVVTAGTVKVSASSWFWETFTNSFNETWYPYAYENQVRVIGDECGLTYCGTFEHDSWFNRFYRLHLLTSGEAGKYNDYEIHTSPFYEPGENPGTYTPTVDHPVVFQARIRFGEGYNPDGTGAATGTIGIGLHRNSNDTGGLGGTLSSISFQWLPDQFTDAFGMDGFTAISAKNSFPMSVKRPTTPINLQEWNFVRFIWSALPSGDQTIEYFINGESLGTVTLLQSAGKTLEKMGGYMWIDNQWYDNTFTVHYDVPSYEQSFDVDFVRITQW